jgi:hypothetical protein
MKANDIFNEPDQFSEATKGSILASAKLRWLVGRTAMRDVSLLYVAGVYLLSNPGVDNPHGSILDIPVEIAPEPELMKLQALLGGDWKNWRDHSITPAKPIIGLDEPWSEEWK